MSTEKIREALGALLAESARANDCIGRPREPSEPERMLYRAALVEVEAIEQAHRLACQMVGSLESEIVKGTVLDPRGLLNALRVLRRALSAQDETAQEEGRS